MELFSYCRHTEEMMKKLKSAGLGWHDETAAQTEKLGMTYYELPFLAIYFFLSIGDIPLRDLVYRVLDLPTSMKALVYDFGSLPSEKERDYIKKIVENRVMLEAKSFCKN